MKSLEAIEGTGEEISRYASEHSRERFLLVPISAHQGPAIPFDEKVWADLMGRIESFRSFFPPLSDAAFTTESLYD